jgi:hypothetical protein
MPSDIDLDPPISHAIADGWTEFAERVLPTVEATGISYGPGGCNSIEVWRHANFAALVTFISLAMQLVVACHSAPPYLPSHPLWEMFPRASSPPEDCPGQYRTTVENSNGSFFMGCWSSLK